MICVFASDATDFTTNGLSVLSPTTCTVTETLNGQYELQLTHPIDEQGKWRYLTTGSIVRAPVPLAATPTLAIDVPEEDTRVDIYTTTSGDYLRAGGSTSYKCITYVKSGVSLILLSDLSRSFVKVQLPSGTKGYFPRSKIAFDHQEGSYHEAYTEIFDGKQTRDQPFRIYKVTPELTQVTVYARHLFYDLLDNMVLSLAPGKTDTGADVLTALSSACESPHEFSFYSDLTSTAEGMELENVNPVDAILGDEGIVSFYGGELQRDWYDVFLVKRVGSDTSIQIREGKNLTALSYDLDSTNVITRIMPTGEDADGERLYLPEIYVDSENINLYPHPKWYHLEVSSAKEVKSGSDKKTKAQCYTELRSAAQAEFDKGCDMPDVTLTVSFLNLSETEEYKNFAPLQSVYPGDAVRVISKRLGLSVSMRMTEYTFDCLTRQYTAVTLGTAADSLSTNTISAAQIPTGSITGTKLTLNSVGTGQLQSGAVKSLQIDTAAIQTAHIEDGAITNAKIYDAAITTAKIDNAAITTGKIEDLAVTEAKIANAAITNAKIQNAAIDTAKIADASITSAKIVDGNITTAKIADLSVDEAKIQNLSVSTAKIANGAITNAKLGNASVDTAQIALGAITTALIENGAVGTLQIADGSITDAKIVSLSANSITTGTLAVERLIIRGSTGSLVYAINNMGQIVSSQVDTIDGYVLTERTITADKIVANAITANEIAASTITGNKIAANTIEGANIKAATIEGSNIKAGEITVAHVTSTFGDTLDLSNNTGINLKVQAVQDDVDDLDERVEAAEILLDDDRITARVISSSQYAQDLENRGYTSLSQATQLSDALEARITSLEDGVALQQRYLRFDENGVEIGAAGSAATLNADERSLAVNHVISQELSCGDWHMAHTGIHFGVYWAEEA